MKIRPKKLLSHGALSVLALVGLATSAPALAAPEMQTCSLMEVMYNGDRAMSYHLPCNAGEWNLTYTGSVPAGLGQTTAHYRLKVDHPNGAGFTLNRNLTLPSPAHLGQALLREAVLLDDGDLALSECKLAGCTTYRPLGALQRVADAQQAARQQATAYREVAPTAPQQRNHSEPSKANAERVAPESPSLSQATITVTPVVKRLMQEKEALSLDVAKLTRDLAQKELVILGHEAQIASLKTELSRAQQQLTEAQAQLVSAKKAIAPAAATPLAVVKEQGTTAVALPVSSSPTTAQVRAIQVHSALQLEPKVTARGGFPTSSIRMRTYEETPIASDNAKPGIK